MFFFVLCTLFRERLHYIYMCNHLAVIHLILQIKLRAVAERDVSTGQTYNTMRVSMR